MGTTEPAVATPGPAANGEGSHEQPEAGDGILEAVCEAWAEVLFVDTVQPDDDFFDLGGHSLPGAEAANLLSIRYSIFLPVDAVFDFPTPAEFAGEIRRLIAASVQGPHPAAAEPAAASAWAAAPQGRSTVEHGLARASVTQEHRLLFLRHLSDGGTQPVALVYEVAGEIKEAALREALNSLLRRHDALRSTFPIRHDDPIAVMSLPDDTSWPIESHDLSQMGEPDREARLRELVIEFSNRGFDLAVGPLVNCLLITADAHRTILGLCLEHLVFDGESIPILLSELSILYEGAESGQPSALPAPPQSYAAYAARQRASLEGDEGKLALRACHDEFDRHGPYPPQLPVKGPGFDVLAVGASKTVTRKLPATLVARVRQAVAASSATFFMACLCAIAAAMRPWCEGDEVGISIMEAARRDPACSGMVANLAFETQVWCSVHDPGDTTGLLRQVRESTRAAINCGVPMWWATRRYHSSPGARLSFTPADLNDRFKVPWLYFSYEPTAPAPDRLGRLAMRPYRAQTEIPVMRTPALISRAFEDAEGWNLGLTFAASGYPEEEVQAMLQRAEQWLTRLADVTR